MRAQEHGIIGETPNIAAQLQALAEPNTAVIAESTRKLLGNLFDLQDLGTKDLKGIVGQVHAWAALRPSAAESRFEALHTTGLTGLVRRGEELELLLRRWSKAKIGEGQVVLLWRARRGESRLTVALLEAVASDPHIRLRNFCSPQHTDTALYPPICQMERAAGFTRDDTSQARLDKLDTLLAQSSTSAQEAALSAEMLMLPNDGRYPVLELTPQQRRQRTLESADFVSGDNITSKPGTDDCRGRPMDRSHEPRAVQSHSGQSTDRPRAADHGVSSRIPATMAGTALCDCAYHQSAD
jgi:hypothetical protein